MSGDPTNGLFCGLSRGSVLMTKLMAELVGDIGGLFLRSLGGGCHERSLVIMMMMSSI